MSKLKKLIKIRWGLSIMMVFAILLFLGGYIFQGFLSRKSGLESIAEIATYSGMGLLFATAYFFTVLDKRIQRAQVESLWNIEKLVLIRRVLLFSLGLGLLLWFGGGFIEEVMPRGSASKFFFQVMEKAGFVLFWVTTAFKAIFISRMHAAKAQIVLWDEYWIKIATKALVTSYFVLLLSLVFGPLLIIFAEVEAVDLLQGITGLAMVFPFFYLVWLDRPGAEGD